MKIAHISHEYYPTISGVGQVVKELAERQVKQGHEVYVFTSDWDKSKRLRIKEEIINGVIIKRYRHFLRVGNFENIWPQFIFSVIKGNFDIIHSHVFGHIHFVLSAIAAKITGAKHVHTTHCPWSDAHRSLVGRLGILVSYNLVSRLALKFTDKIIAITPWEFDFMKRYGGTEEQTINLPNGMDKIFFEKIKNNSFKKEHNIRDKMVLFFGRLNVVKAPDKFVEIAHSILKERRDVTFVIRGSDEGMRAKVKKLIGDEKKILLLDVLRDRKKIVEMYQAADVFVLPSYREGLPLTLFEAMAAGNPVVATPVNGVPYEMNEPKNGFLVKYGDNEGFKKRIIQLLDDPELRKKISENNRKMCSQYTWDIIAKKTLKLYENLLTSSRKK